jgi:hypothetical protein
VSVLIYGDCKFVYVISEIHLLGDPFVRGYGSIVMATRSWPHQPSHCIPGRELMWKLMEQKMDYDRDHKKKHGNPEKVVQIKGRRQVSFPLRHH